MGFLAFLLALLSRALLGFEHLCFPLAVLGTFLGSGRGGHGDERAPELRDARLDAGVVAAAVAAVGSHLNEKHYAQVDA